MTQERMMLKPYTILRKIQDGQILAIVRFKELEEARQLVASLREHWPAEYYIQGPEGNVIQEDATVLAERLPAL
jgi:hypothetical protein